MRMKGQPLCRSEREGKNVGATRWCRESKRATHAWEVALISDCLSSPDPLSLQAELDSGVAPVGINGSLSGEIGTPRSGAAGYSDIAGTTAALALTKRRAGG